MKVYLFTNRRIYNHSHDYFYDDNTRNICILSQYDHRIAYATYEPDFGNEIHSDKFDFTLPEKLIYKDCAHISPTTYVMEMIEELILQKLLD